MGQGEPRLGLNGSISLKRQGQCLKSENRAWKAGTDSSPWGRCQGPIEQAGLRSYNPGKIRDRISAIEPQKVGLKLWLKTIFP